MLKVEITRIVESPLNPRRRWDEAALQDLADSILQLGILQPLVVRPQGAGYELVCGGRRLRAAHLAGLTTVPVVVRELEDDEVAMCQLVENSQRSDVSSVEESDAIARLVDAGVEPEEIAERLGRPLRWVQSRLRLQALIEPYRQLLEDGRIPLGGALMLAALPRERQDELAADDAYDAIRPDAERYDQPRTWTRREIRSAIERRCRWLDQAPWPLEQPLGPRACLVCRTRSGAQPDLWGEARGGDRCLDPACWEQHRKAWLQHLRDSGADIREGYPDDPVAWEQASDIPRRAPGTCEVCGQPEEECRGTDEDPCTCPYCGESDCCQECTAAVAAAPTWDELAPESVPRVAWVDPTGRVTMRLPAAELAAAMRELGRADLADQVDPGDVEERAAAREEGREAAERTRQERARRKAQLDDDMAELAHRVEALRREGAERVEELLPEVLRAVLIEVQHDTLQAVCRRRDVLIPDEGHDRPPREGMRAYIDAMAGEEAEDVAEMWGLLVELLATQSARVWAEHDWLPEHAPWLRLRVVMGLAEAPEEDER